MLKVFDVSAFFPTWLLSRVLVLMETFDLATGYSIYFAVLNPERFEARFCNDWTVNYCNGLTELLLIA